MGAVVYQRGSIEYEERREFIHLRVRGAWAASMKKYPDVPEDIRARDAETVIFDFSVDTPYARWAETKLNVAMKMFCEGRMEIDRVRVYVKGYISAHLRKFKGSYEIPRDAKQEGLFQ